MDRGGKAHAGQIIAQPIGGGPHIARMGRIGRDRGDAQQREQARQRRLQIGIDTGQNGVKRHGGLRFGRCSEHEQIQAARKCPDSAKGPVLG